MTRGEAKALLRLQRVVNRAVDSALKAVPLNERDHAEAYWAGALRNCVNGRGYGSCPVDIAEETLSQ